jgi:hypothetical protein
VAALDVGASLAQPARSYAFYSHDALGRKSRLPGTVSRSMGGGATTTCATGTAATGLGGRRGDRERVARTEWGRMSVERRPILLRSPRGARGVLASKPRPRWGLRWQHTVWRPTSRGTLQSAGCQKRFQVDLFESIFLQKFQQKWSKVSIPKLYATLPSTTLPKALGSFSQPVVHKSHGKLAVFWAPVNSNLRC